MNDKGEGQDCGHFRWGSMVVARVNPKCQRRPTKSSHVHQCNHQLLTTTSRRTPQTFQKYAPFRMPPIVLAKMSSFVVEAVSVFFPLKIRECFVRAMVLVAVKHWSELDTSPKCTHCPACGCRPPLCVGARLCALHV